MTDTFKGSAVPLTQEGFDAIVRQLELDIATVWALLTVETRGFGFLQDRRPKILYERHIFHRRTNGRHSTGNPDISSNESGGYSGGIAEYGRLQKAMKLNRRAALESVSWGLGQIMGFNAVNLRYAGVDEMITTFLEGEDAQLEGVLRFIAGNEALRFALKRKKWREVAFFYNGEAYAKHAYHIKLERYHDLYSVKEPPDINVRAAQARLTFLGFDPRGVDGLLGDGTRAAVLAFQKAKGMSPTAELDDQTMEELKTAAAV